MSEQVKVKIVMEDGGVMLAELYPDIAPKTVENGEITLTVTFPNGESVTRTVPVSAEPLHPNPVNGE